MPSDYFFLGAPRTIKEAVGLINNAYPAIMDGAPSGYNYGWRINVHNKWIVSVRIGWGNYCEHHLLSDFSGMSTEQIEASKTAEVAVWPLVDGSDGEIVTCPGENSDGMFGWQEPDDVLNIVDAVATGKDVCQAVRRHR